MRSLQRLWDPEKSQTEKIYSGVGMGGMRQAIRAATRHEQQPAFILEGKASVKSSRGDGAGREARSVSPSPATPPLTQAESPGPWQSESLLAESWSTMGDLDPDDTKSLDSSNGAAAAGEENHSSNSDMVHLEMLEEAESVGRAEEEEEEDEGLQTSVLSVLGGERELEELSEEEEEEEEEEDIQAPDMEELLVSAEEPQLAEFRPLVPPLTLPPLPVVKLDPPSTTSTPVPSTIASEVEDLYPTQGLLPPSILAPIESLEQIKFLSDVEEHSVQVSQAASGRAAPRPAAPQTGKALSSTELLCGGAVLVAVVGVVAYGAVAFCRK